MQSVLQGEEHPSSSTELANVKAGIPDILKKTLFFKITLKIHIHVYVYNA